MKRTNRLRPAEPSKAPVTTPKETQARSGTVKFTPGFCATAASWFLSPEELARRVCEDFARSNPPGTLVIFILDKREEGA